MDVMGWFSYPPARRQRDADGGFLWAQCPWCAMPFFLCGVYWLWREPSSQSQEPAALWQSCSSLCWGKLTPHVPFDSNGSQIIRDPWDCQLPPWNRKSILNKSFRIPGCICSAHNTWSPDPSQMQLKTISTVGIPTEKRCGISYSLRQQRETWRVLC